MPYEKNQTQTEEVFSFAVAEQKGEYLHFYGSRQAVNIKLSSLMRRYPQARIIKRYDEIGIGKIREFEAIIEAKNSGENISLEDFLK